MLENLESRRLLAVTLSAAGWTQVTPSADTQVIYVSSSQGNDTNNGLSMSSPVKTIAKGESLLTTGHPDFLLLKRGDIWNESLGQWLWPGRSADEPSLISSYGSGARPELKTGGLAGLYMGGGGAAPATMDNVDVTGINFYQNTSDPNSPDFVGTSANDGLIYFRPGQNILVEDCVFQYYANNLDIQGEGGGLSNFTLRRSVIIGAYNTLGHSQGIYMQNVHGALLEENVFDHNGWNASVPGADQTIFNHNIYVQFHGNGDGTDCSDVTLLRNIIANASSHGAQLRPGGTAIDNLFVNDPVGLLVGSAASGLNQTGQVSGNVFLYGNDIGSTPRGFGLEMAQSIVSALVGDNIIAHDGSAQPYGNAISIDSGASGVVINANTIYQWRGGIVDGGTGTTLSNNEIDGTGYPDPTRSIGSYNASLGGGATTDAFLAAVEERSAQSWNPNYTAQAAINYIAAGFGKTPKAAAGGPYSVREGGTVQLSAAASTGDTLTYAWDLDGDGIFGETGTAAARGDETGATPTFSAAGLIAGDSKTVWLRVTNAAGFSDTISTTISVIRVRDALSPSATLSPLKPLTQGGHLFSATVTYTDHAGLNLATLDRKDILATGPDGFSAIPKSLSVVNGLGTAKIVTYKFNAPDDAWSPNWNGTYTFQLRDGQVADAAGNTIGAQSLGSLSVRIVPPDAAGNTLGKAKSLPAMKFGIVQTVQDYVGSVDRDDYYKLSLSSKTILNLTMDNLVNNASLQLLDAKGTVLSTSNARGNTPESISKALFKGTYYVRVLYSPANAGTTYRLRFDAVAPSVS